MITKERLAAVTGSSSGVKTPTENYDAVAGSYCCKLSDGKAAAMAAHKAHEFLAAPFRLGGSK